MKLLKTVMIFLGLTEKTKTPVRKTTVKKVVSKKKK